MILHKIRISNIKSYYGEHVLEFPHPTADKCIHLVGARNGSGKTALFEAINACFFASQNNPILTADYLSRGSDAQEMNVEIEFEHESQSYRLSRRWVRSPGQSETSARSVNLHSLLQNIDTKDSSRDDESIADFVDGLMPRPISHFFLFDGEQIQEYTDAAADSVRNALERLLGLHHYIQLLDDLRGTVERDFRRDRDSYSVKEVLDKKLEARDSVEVRLKASERRRVSLRSASHEAKRELELLEREKSRIDSVFDEHYQSRRRELTAERERLNHDIEDRENELKGLISKELVIALFWPQLQKASTKLPDSARPFELEELIGFLWEHRKEIISALSKDTPEQLQVTLMSVVGIKPETALYSSVSEGIGELVGLVQGSKEKLRTLPYRLDDLKAKLDQVLHELGTLPSPEAIDTNVQDLHRRMEAAQRTQARHESSLSDLANENGSLSRELEDLSRDIDELGSQDKEFQRLDSQLSLCRNIQNVLNRFIADYRWTRIEELEEAFNRKFQDLTNSPEALGRIEIDRDTFNINIASRSRTDLTASEQSAGQKEVLAFALIASVVELSNRQLPIVIDTPLARLDVIHRDNILTKFFPEVGQQVIVLSTDAEVGLEEHRRLIPYLASEHHLVRDAETGRTSIKEGYLVK